MFSVSAQKKSYRLIVGTYTNTGSSKGIYSYDINLKNGVFAKLSVEEGLINPSFLAFSPSYKFVYTVNENGKASKVTALSFDIKSGKFTRLNEVDAQGADPCYILATKNHVITANYSGGSISVFGRNADGSITNALQVIQHTGSSVNAERQGVPHVHQVLLTQDKKFVIANDLGTDKVTVYQYNSNATKDVLVPFDSITVKLGSGPRHATFSADGKLLYILHEIDGTLSVLRMKNGRLSMLQETNIVKKENVVIRAAEIFFSPDYHFIYTTDRGTDNVISCFSVGTDGKLTFVQQFPTDGVEPRNFAITPDGEYVLVANQLSDKVVVYSRNAKTGMLTDTGERMHVGQPVCLKFY